MSLSFCFPSHHPPPLCFFFFTIHTCIHTYIIQLLKLCCSISVNYFCLIFIPSEVELMLLDISICFAYLSIPEYDPFCMLVFADVKVCEWCVNYQHNIITRIRNLYVVNYNFQLIYLFLIFSSINEIQHLKHLKIDQNFL
jgi:hypothetical protein